MGVGVAGQGAVGGAARLEAARAARGAGAPVSAHHHSLLSSLSS